jgi:hypothetical protein
MELEPILPPFHVRLMLNFIVFDQYTLQPILPEFPWNLSIILPQNLFKQKFILIQLLLQLYWRIRVNVAKSWHSIVNRVLVVDFKNHELFTVKLFFLNFCGSLAHQLHNKINYINFYFHAHLLNLLRDLDLREMIPVLAY